MTFRDDARLDPSQVSSGGGGGGVMIGGGVGLVILIASLLLGIDPTSILDAVPTDTTVQNGPAATDCQTGAQANARDDCRIVGFVNSVQKYWSDEFQQQGRTYQPATTVLFSGATQSSCGTAQTAMGPF